MQMKRLTASDQIYEILRSQILFLELKPGGDLNMQKLLTQTGMSRSPLRDALLRLQKDNLVEIFPQRGSRISKINLKQVEVERFMRLTMELAVVPSFAEICAKEHLFKMRTAIESQKIALENKDYAGFLNNDDSFHKIIFTETGMERLWNISQNQSGNYRRIRFLSGNIPGVLNKILDEHEMIMEAFSKKDGEKALELEKAHLTKLLTELDIMTKKYPDYFEA
ncbi:GntR family transcriptional regulator [Treponema parvum]|uniref:GntR family transcriptional regulator n=1 Tax=Treponema parvum TaxID=138851 RepID=A0A975F2I5_9SPIR|nr:GntR family transcriptional regulator [Treponema parvum]QTQ13203.1 GntR family transcriptional regulator [Treponema parvum]